MSARSPIIARLPVSFFTITMGMAGFTMALRAGETALGLTAVMSWVAYGVTLVLFAIITTLYALKALTQFKMVQHEWCEPDRLALFPAFSITMILLAAATLPLSEPLAHMIWLGAVPVQLIVTLAVVSGWIGHRSFKTNHISPAWFVPAVGNGLVPIAGVPLGHIDLSWFFMSVAITFWGVLLAMVMNRLIFHDPLERRLQPTLVILIAPPAVAFLGWVQLAGEIDAMARILLNASYFFVLVVALHLPRIVRLEFTMSFWALSFPFAAITSASFAYARLTGSAIHNLFGLILLAVLCAIITSLLWRTAKALHNGTALDPG